MNSYEFSKMHQKELLEEAERYRMISLSNQKSSSKTNYLAAGLNWWGGELIRWGSMIQRRFGDQVTSENSRVMN